MDTEYYDDIIIGGGKAGKTLAPALVANGQKTALVERSLNTIGGGCINLACIPTKTMVASAEIANTVRHSAAYGINTAPPTVDLATVIQRKRLPPVGYANGCRIGTRNEFAQSRNGSRSGSHYRYSAVCGS